VWVKVCCFDVGGPLGRVARLADAHGTNEKYIRSVGQKQHACTNRSSRMKQSSLATQHFVPEIPLLHMAGIEVETHTGTRVWMACASCEAASEKAGILMWKLIATTTSHNHGVGRSQKGIKEVWFEMRSVTFGFGKETRVDSGSGNRTGRI
jgi:hypothetical protein